MKKSNGTWYLLVGLVLFLVSSYPLFLIFREIYFQSYVNSRYTLEEILDIRNRSQPANPQKQLQAPIAWHGNIIEVETEDTGVTAPEDPFYKRPRHIMDITVKVNGTIAASPTQAWLSPNINQDSNYLSWFHLVDVFDKETGIDRLAVIQRLTGDSRQGENIDRHTKAQTWRILYVGTDKQVNEETFSYPDRKDHLLGVRLVQLSSQASSFMGYASDTPYSLPNLFYPLVYPTCTCLLGTLLLVIGGIRFLTSRRV